MPIGDKVRIPRGIRNEESRLAMLCNVIGTESKETWKKSDMWRMAKSDLFSLETAPKPQDVPSDDWEGKDVVERRRRRTWGKALLPYQTWRSYPAIADSSCLVGKRPIRVSSLAGLVKLGRPWRSVRTMTVLEWSFCV